jgi:arylsulfatase A-like enzyme
MDAAIGRVLVTLGQLGLRENTLVLFMSDNGMNCGHHGIWGKGNGTRPQNMYDTSVKVPCIVSHPGRIPTGHVNGHLLSGYDVFPTLIDYLGLANEDQRPRPGRSFRRILDGQGGAGHDEIVVYDEYGPVRMVRTRDWKYVHRYPSGPHELFDLGTDPGERNNLVDDARSRVVADELRGRLESWFRQYVDPQRDGVDKGVTGCGQIARIDRPGARAAFADGHTESTDWDLWLEKKHA